MIKDKNQIDLLWQYTHAIDSWIIENISFSTNGWGQKVQVGSCLIHIHGQNDPDLPRADVCDVIRYDRSPGSTANDEDSDALFIIYYYADRAEFALYERRENSDKLVLAYEDPTMFDKLEACIWNCRTIDYIYSDLKAMEENIRLIRSGLWEDPQKMVRKSMGHLGAIFETVMEVDKHVRKVARHFMPTEDVAMGYNASSSEPKQWPEDDQDEIPF